MSKIDDAIRRALSPDDQHAYDALARERTPIEEALNAFQNQHRLFALAAWAGGFLLFAAFLYAAWRFAQASDMRGMLAWGGGAAAALFSLGIVKIWFFLEMQRNSIVREVKRLELQVASLATLLSRA